MFGVGEWRDSLAHSLSLRKKGRCWEGFEEQGKGSDPLKQTVINGTGRQLS